MPATTAPRIVITSGIFPLAITVLGAVVAGVPSAAATLTGVHWLGVAVGIVLFALWCGWLAARGDRRSAVA